MNNDRTIKIIGLKELERAFANSPKTVKKEAKVLFVRSLALFRAEVTRNPWRVGGNGGGVPVDTKLLRTSHRSMIRDYSLIYGLPQNIADKYGLYVHNGTLKLDARPWLNYAVEKTDSKIKKLGDEFLTNVVKDLVK